ncbi:hypothetical protein NQ314_003834 [Rhamnusium bicolor]|uniref:Uncharacterized protein n=1 Tax=Rhamnusium bicolor TaxID=1586634 RepID=A0AAV8ZLV0_9CUCU|nr:hypothetical protein NQ314_003834 [Rhamnusium bicolor]
MCFNNLSTKMNILKREISYKLNFGIHIRNGSYESTRPNLILKKESKVICQGFTGNTGTLHSKLCIEYGTKMVEV